MREVSNNLGTFSNVKIMSKKLKKEKKDSFFRNHAELLHQKGVKIYPHFVKVYIKDDQYDFYPGAGRLAKISPGQKIEWIDLDNDEFINILKKYNC